MSLRKQESGVGIKAIPLPPSVWRQLGYCVSGEFQLAELLFGNATYANTSLWLGESRSSYFKK